MDVHDRVEIRAVAAPEDDRDGRARPPGRREHEAIPLREPRLRDGTSSVPGCLRSGKFLAPWIDIVNTLGSAAKIWAVPLP